MDTYQKRVKRNSKKKVPKNKIILVFSALFIVLVSNLIIIKLLNEKADKYIYQGLSINNISLGGLSKEDGSKKLEETLNKPLTDKKHSLIYKDKEIPLTAEDIDLKYDVDEIIEEAFSYKKAPNMIKEFFDRLYLSHNPVNFNKNFAFNEGKLDKFLEDLSNSLHKDPKNATITFNSGKFTVTEDADGLQIKTDDLKQLVLNDINENKEGNVTIPTEPIEANKKYADLSKIKDNITNFSTTLTSTDPNRTENIVVAAKALNGSVVMPGETFSMNKTLGPRTPERGYKDAIIFEHGKPVPGLAGGICQLVSTLYNTVLYTDLEVVERVPHSNVISYVKLGLDATIAGDQIDFKFKNNKAYPIYIESLVKGKDVIVNFYGEKEKEDKKVVLYNTQSCTKDKCYAEGYKEVYKNGVLVSKTRLSKNVYINE